MSDPIGVQPRDERDDRTAVLSFAESMLIKLRENAHKAHWDTVTDQWLLARLRVELGELEEAIFDGGDVIGEAADVANFAMMIADKRR